MERVSSRPGKIYADPSKSPKQVFLNVFAFKELLLGSDPDQTQKNGYDKNAMYPKLKPVALLQKNLII